MNSIEGFLLINKPSGISSFDCIRHIRRIIGKQHKIGHAGTLDPFATGLIIIAISRNATKLIALFSELDKKYRAIGKVGLLTDTLDKTGTTLQESTASFTPHRLQQSIDRLGNSYEQTPPIYSARRIEGARLYRIARRGKNNAEELDALAHQRRKTVHLHSIHLEECAPPFFTITAHVSHGTYIRCLVNDIARHAESYATTIELQRTNIGPLTIEQAIALHALQSATDIATHLIPINQLVAHIKSV
jgi:tRNA pseudouridine55 synthase